MVRSFGTTTLSLLLLFCIIMFCKADLQAQQLIWRVNLDSTWVLSSPHLVDLNQDQTQDVVIGAGAEDQANDKGVVAIDGSTGQLLWEVPARNQVYSTAITYDLNGDGVRDIFICGRDAIFYAINGATGDLLWEFWPDSLGSAKEAGWYNFYQPTFVKDLDGDFVPEILTSNGGDASAKAFEKNRPAGKLVLLSGADGSLLMQDSMPDGKETYFPPLTYEVAGDPLPWVIFGSGGETIGGHLWRISLSEFILNGLSDAFSLIEDTSKGFIAHPSWADLNQDGDLELVVPQFDGAISILDLPSGQMLNKITYPGYEHYSSPLIGYINSDSVPDIYSTMALGKWPFYQEYLHVLIDGASMTEIWSDTSGFYQLTQANSLDIDLDGQDEILRMSNKNSSNISTNYFNRFEILDFGDHTLTSLGTDRPGLNIFSTPSLSDIDNNSLLDVIYAYSPSTKQWSGNNGNRIERWESSLMGINSNWSAYLGNQGDGRFIPSTLASTGPREVSHIHVYPNPFRDWLYVDGIDHSQKLIIQDLNGKILREFLPHSPMNLDNLPSGSYLLLSLHRGWTSRHLIVKD